MPYDPVVYGIWPTCHGWGAYPVTPVSDESGHGNDLTVRGGIPLTDGWGDFIFYGGGERAYRLAGSSAGLNAAAEWGIGGRIHTPSGSGLVAAGIVGKTDHYGNPTDGYGCYLESAGPPPNYTVHFFLVQDGTKYEVSYTQEWTTGVPYSWAVRKSKAGEGSGSFLKLYVNGVLRDTVYCSPGNADSNDDEFAIGQWANSGYYLGYMRELWVVQECPTEAQVLDIHNDGFASVYGLEAATYSALGRGQFAMTVSGGTGVGRGQFTFVTATGTQVGRGQFAFDQSYGTQVGRGQFIVGTPMVAPLILANDEQTGESVIVHILGEPATEHLWYKVHGVPNWGDEYGSREGNGDIRVTGLTLGQTYDFKARTSILGPPVQYSGYSNVATVTVTGPGVPPFPMGALTHYDHWWFDWPTKSFTAEVFQTTHQPTTVCDYGLLDSGDSVVLLGCQDGYVRYFSETAATDDGFEIHSGVLFGPIRLGGADGFDGLVYEMVLSLAKGSGEVTWSTYVAPTHEAILDALPFRSGTLEVLDHGGLNYTVILRARGGSFALLLENAEADRGWAYEYGTILVAPLTKQRLY